MSMRQSRSFHLISFVEVWERFGYYGVTALLVIFMATKLGYSDSYANLLFGGFSALVFLLPALGGFIGDRILGTKRTLILGAVILAIGYALLSIPSIGSHYLALPLAVIAVGNGLFKPNPSSLVSRIYDNLKKSKDAGFTLFYMSINIGSMLSMILAPILRSYFGYSAAFVMCFLGLVLAIAAFMVGKSKLKEIGSTPDFKSFSFSRFFTVIAGTVAVIFLCYLLLTHPAWLSTLLITGAAFLIAIYLRMTFKVTPKERAGMLIFLFLFIEAIVFFILYFQMPTSVNLFALRNVTHQIFGIPVEAETFQALNGITIVVFSPLLAWWYNRRYKNKKDFSLPTKFTAGIFLCALAFFALVFANQYAVGGIISGNWLVLFYVLQSIGELLISALGLSLAARYIPTRFLGFVMGLWFLSASLAGFLGGYVASFAAVPQLAQNTPLDSLPIYTALFTKIGFVTLSIAIIMALLTIPLNRLVKRHEQEALQSEVLS